MRRLGRAAGVHGEHGAGDVAPALAHEIGDHRGDVTRFGEPAQSRALGEGGRNISGAVLTVDAGGTA